MDTEHIPDVDRWLQVISDSKAPMKQSVINT